MDNRPQAAEKLSLHRSSSQEGGTAPITPRDAVVEIADGSQLPSVPVAEAERLNRLSVDIGEIKTSPLLSSDVSTAKQRQLSTQQQPGCSSQHQLDIAIPPGHTHTLFPPLPKYGPPSLLRNIQYHAFRAISLCLSLSLLSVVIVSAGLSGIPIGLRRVWLRLSFQDPFAKRRFYEEEQQRKRAREEAARKWKQRRQTRHQQKPDEDCEEGSMADEFPPREGGKDPVVCDIGYYARRVGLDVETFKVQTEDGFILTLWHIYNPKDYMPLPAEERGPRQPQVFYEKKEKPSTRRRYPVLLMHGLLQGAGVYCTNDDDSLAFYLHKSGYDVWLGNNRCGFKPEHTVLAYSDPRMWTWNIRHMGVLDLPAFVSRVLYETGFEKLGLVCHSQGTTETLVALAKDHRPELGKHLSVFCGLAPAAYAGPLVETIYFRFIRVMSPAAFRLFFGIHAFIPLTMTIQNTMPSRLYGSLGYQVFSYLFGWTDERWDRGLRDRMFQFAPVYVSAESIRWWLGRDGFATHRCILSTKEEGVQEEEEDRMYEDGLVNSEDWGSKAWYNDQVPPFALWIGGSDGLIDGRRLLRRLQNGREPHVRIVHSKIIEEYEHLDFIWAIDSIEQVGCEIREVIWKTIPDDIKSICLVPRGIQEPS
ncbi:Alpha/Beta hydrolase fold [Elaphomyces granulatus]